MKRSRILINFVILLFLSVTAQGQDIIVTEKSNIIRARIVRMDDSGIYYDNESDDNSIRFLDANSIKSIRFKENKELNDLPDFLIVKNIDDKYLSLLQSGIIKATYRPIELLNSYYSQISEDKELRIRELLRDRIVRAAESQSPNLKFYTQEYLSVVPFEYPGRAALYELLSQFYEASMSLSELEELKDEIEKYEIATNQKYNSTRSVIILATARVKKALKMKDELVGFWVSDTCTENNNSPLFFLYITKDSSDTLSVHFLTTASLGDFEDTDEPVLSQRILLNGVKEEFDFTFANDEITGGNFFLAESVVAFGSSLSSAAAERSTLKSNNYGTVNTNSFISSLATAAAIELMKSRKRIEILDVYGKRLNPNVLSSQLLYIKNVVTAGEPDVDIVREKEIDVYFYRVELDDDIYFIDEEDILRGAETEYWSKEQRSDWWQSFAKSQAFIDLQEKTGTRINKKSIKTATKAINTVSYDKLYKKYGKQN